MLISPTCLCNFFSTNRETGFPFKGTSYDTLGNALRDKS